MPVPTQLSDLSTTASANGPQSTETLSTGDDYIRAVQSIIKRVTTGVDAMTSPAFSTLTIPSSASPAQTAEGSAVWDSDDDVLTVGTGAGRKTLVNTDNTQTLTNKTLTNPAFDSGTVYRATNTGNQYMFHGSGFVAHVKPSVSYGYFWMTSADGLSLTGQKTLMSLFDNSLDLGDQTGQKFIQVSGGATSASEGSFFSVAPGGVWKARIGNYSSLFGGVYSANSVLQSANSWSIYTNTSTLAATIDASGNVGIGETSAGARLHVYGDINNSATALNSNDVATAVVKNQSSAVTNVKAKLNFSVGGGTGAATVAGVYSNFNGVGDIGTSLIFGTQTNLAGGVVERMRIDANGFNSITGSFGRGAPVTKTADFTVATTENFLINNKSGSTCTVTLPAASSFTGREITIKTIQAQTVVSASSNVIPLAGGAAGTAILAATAGKWATLVSNGTNWEIMAAG